MAVLNRLFHDAIGHAISYDHTNVEGMLTDALPDATISP